MKTLLIATVAFVLLAADALAAKWTPTGGTQGQAPAGTYTGAVERTATGGVVKWKVTTDKGVLEITKGEDGLSAAEEESLDLAATQNDKNNEVKIDKNGKVDSVSTG